MIPREIKITLTKFKSKIFSKRKIYAANKPKIGFRKWKLDAFAAPILLIIFNHRKFAIIPGPIIKNNNEKMKILSRFISHVSEKKLIGVMVKKPTNIWVHIISTSITHSYVFSHIVISTCHTIVCTVEDWS